MAESSSLDSILKYGLLSTCALLDLYEIIGKKRESIECCRRPDSVTIHHPEFGRAVIRDQKPMSDSKLTQCLTDCRPDEWYRFLNSKVFFWTSATNLSGLLKARAYSSRSHTIFVVDCRRLLEEYFDKIYLCHINSGAMPYGPTPRGIETFVKISDWPPAIRPRAGGLVKKVVELTVDYSIPNFRSFLVRVEERKGDNII